MDLGRWITCHPRYGTVHLHRLSLEKSPGYGLLPYLCVRSFRGENLAVVVIAVAALHDIIATMADFAPDITDSYGQQVSVIMRLQQLMLDARDFLES